MASKKPTSTQIVAICAWCMLSKNDICVCGAKRRFFKNIEKVTFGIWDVYPSKIDRMTILSIPGDSSHQGASFEARFAHDSLSKTFSFSWNTEKIKTIFSTYTPQRLIVFENLLHHFVALVRAHLFAFLLFFAPSKNQHFFQVKSQKIAHGVEIQSW